MRKPPSRQAAMRLKGVERLGGLAALLLALTALMSGCKAGPSAPIALPDAAAAPSDAALPDGASDAAPGALADAAAEAASIDDSGVDSWKTVKLKPNDPCLVKCQKVARELSCGDGEGCRENCAKLRGAQFCAKQARAFIACFVKQPKIRWTCESHLPILDEACGSQQAAMSDCLMSSGGKL